MNDQSKTAADMPLPGGNFQLFVTRMSIQGMMALGLLENPLTGRKDLNLHNAQMMVDDLKMLQAKTVGNLEPDEQNHLDKVVSDLEHYLSTTSAARSQDAAKGR